MGPRNVNWQGSVSQRVALSARWRLAVYKAVQVLRWSSVVVAVFGVAAEARATDYFWTDADSGVFANPVQWTPFNPMLGQVGPGGSLDTVNFNHGVAPANRYTVLDVTGENDRLLVHNDSLTLNIPDGPNNSDYRLLNSNVDDFTTPSLTVGLASGDIGDVLLTGDGVLETNLTSIGHAAGSTGLVTVDGLEWVSDYGLFVGLAGSGTLNIQGGGSVESFAGTIGNDSSSAGNVTIDGAGSSWTITLSNLFVGFDGQGTLTVRNGGSLTSNDSLSASVIGLQSGAAGSVLVTGAGSIWNHSRAIVGELGVGSLTIASGGSVSGGAGIIGFQPSSIGTVTVTGAGSTWDLSELLVGDGGWGTLRIEDGGLVRDINGNIGFFTGSIAAATVTGAGSTWTNSDDLFVGGSFLGPGGTALLTITDQGLVEVAGTTTIFAAGQVHLNGGTLRTGQIDLAGGRLHWTAGTFHLTGAGGMTVGPAGLLGDTLLLNQNQTLIVDHGLAIETGALLVSANGLNAGSVSVAADGRLFVGGGLQNLGAGLDNHGHVKFIDSTVIEGPVFNAAGAIITALDDATFNDAVAGGGEFLGPGTVIFQGGLSPGESAAAVSFESDVVLGSANTLAIELGGLQQGTMYDALEIGGAAMLDGILQVTLIDPFQPAAGDNFDILDFANLSGTFEALSLPALSAGLMWNASELYTLGVLNVALAGDYNLDGTVDAADYVVWRKMLDQTGDYLAADGDGDGEIDAEDYNVWRAHFGQAVGSGSGATGSASANAAVPEPASSVLAVAAAIAMSLLGWRRP